METTLWTGSSPRAWGGCADGEGFGAGGRFIPTGVGRLPRSWRCSRCRPVHPHGRGAVAFCRATSSCLYGSSPRAWGGFVAGFREVRRVRFIPTGVGRLTLDTFTATIATVHPHGRGAVITRARRLPRASGSSPRAWGGYDLDVTADARGRFIPTGVGRFPDATGRLRIALVHPHGRGAVEAVGADDAAVAGSSPRAWGGSCATPQAVPSGRFIPTGVGRFAGQIADALLTAVHPHGRGAVRGLGIGKNLAEGSSPRAWGGWNRDLADAA